MQPRVAVVIVSFNVAGLLAECLQSLDNAKGVQLETWVVDNASADGSPELVRQQFPQVHLIDNSDNRGFGAACNQALRAIASRQEAAPDFDHVLLLNPDTRVPADALARLCAFLDAHPDCGVAGPRLLRPDGSLDLACRRSFPTPEVSLYRQLGLSRLFPRSPRFARYNLTFLDEEQTYPVDAVVGAFMLIRWEAIRQAGFLDERFWMYAEDLDWCLRIRQAGWQVYYCGEVVVLHHKGASSRRASDRATREFYRAMLLFYRKHYAQDTPLPVAALMVGGIYGKGTWAVLRNRLRPAGQKRVSG